MEETGCEVICGAPTTPSVKGWVKVEVKAKIFPERYRREPRSRGWGRGEGEEKGKPISNATHYHRKKDSASRLAAVLPLLGVSLTVDSRVAQKLTIDPRRFGLFVCTRM